MFAALSTFARAAGSWLGRGLSGTGSSFTQNVVRGGAQRILGSAERGITGFLNGQPRTEENQQGTPVTSTLFNMLGLTALGPHTLLAIAIIAAVVGLMIISFVFITQVAPWPEGLY
jgi:hypothetical protein